MSHDGFFSLRSLIFVRITKKSPSTCKLSNHNNFLALRVIFKPNERLSTSELVIIIHLNKINIMRVTQR